MWRYWKMKREIEDLRKIAFDYQQDWHRMMNLVKKMSEQLEELEDLNQRLMKHLKKK